MYDKLFLTGGLEMLVIVRDQSIRPIQVFCQIPLVTLQSVDPSNHMGNDWVPLLGFDPVTICEIAELLMLFHYLSGSDYHFLVYPFTFLYHVDVVCFSLGRITNTGTIQQFPYGSSSNFSGARLRASATLFSEPLRYSSFMLYPANAATQQWPNASKFGVVKM